MYIEPVAVNVISIHAILTTDEIPLIPSQAYSWDDHPLLCRPHFSPWGPPCVLTIYTVRTLHSCRWALGRGKEGCLLSERYSLFISWFWMRSISPWHNLTSSYPGSVFTDRRVRPRLLFLCSRLWCPSSSWSREDLWSNWRFVALVTTTHLYLNGLPKLWQKLTEPANLWLISSQVTYSMAVWG